MSHGEPGRLAANQPTASAIKTTAPMAPSKEGNRTAPSALRRESPPLAGGEVGGHRSAISETAMPWCAQANHLNDKGATVHECGHESGLPSTNAATNARILQLLHCCGIWLRTGKRERPARERAGNAGARATPARADAPDALLLSVVR